MGYRSVLVHLAGERRMKSPLRFARALAEAHGAHLTGLAVMSAYTDPPPLTEGT